MFDVKKAYRVKREQDFRAIFHHKQSVANRQFVVYSLRKEGQSHFRAGVSVSKKLGNAVVRNTVKRRMRHALMALSDRIHPMYDLVIIARQPALFMSATEMVRSLEHVLTLAELVKK